MRMLLALSHADAATTASGNKMFIKYIESALHKLRKQETMDYCLLNFMEQNSL